MVISDLFDRLPWKYVLPRGLKPNCLLTRYPVVFLKTRETGWRRHFDPWMGLPRYLKNHGYQIEFADSVPVTSLTASPRIHLFLEKKDAARVIDELERKSRPDFIKTVTVVELPRRITRQRIAKQAARFLQHCISLAENDLTTAE